METGQEPWLSAYDRLISDADAWIDEEPSAIAEWEVPTYYDDEDGHIAATQILLFDLKSAYACGLAYYFTGERRYGDQAVRILNNWAEVSEKGGYHDTPLVGRTVGGGFAMTAELIKSYNGWAEADQDKFKLWLKDVYLDQIIEGGHVWGNWGAWKLFARVVTMSYLEMDISKEIEDLQNRIRNDINDAGFLIAEIDRGANGMWYTYFALAPLTAAAQVIYNTTGDNLFYYQADNGRTLKMALDTFLIYCVDRTKVWPYHSGPVAYPTKLESYSWPLPLYESMIGIYGDNKYEEFIGDSNTRPLYGPFNSGRYHHIAWFYPTLMYRSLQLAE